MRIPFLSKQRQNEIEQLESKTRKMQTVNKRAIHSTVTSHEKKKCPTVLYPLSHLKTTSRVGVFGKDTFYFNLNLYGQLWES